MFRWKKFKLIVLKKINFKKCLPKKHRNFQNFVKSYVFENRTPMLWLIVN